MKIAHLLLTHANPAQLKRLMDSLAHPDADFYIHVDLKADIGPFLPLADNKHIFLIKKREKVFWGAYSIVQATVNAFYEIMGSGKKYDFINLLSGQDYPLKSTEEIHDFLGLNRGKAFMHTLSITDEWQEAIPRITRYHLSNYQFAGRHQAEKLLNFLLPERKMPNGLIPVGRSQWFTITPTHVKYILEYLEKNRHVQRFFELTWGVDEIIFQTLLYNSPHKDEMVNDNLRYIDWSEGKASPKTFTIQDLSVLTHSGKLFARKFNENIDSDILNALDKLRANS